MIAFTDDRPDVNVVVDEYSRLLGYPRGMVLDGRALELATSTRNWFAQHGHPWVTAAEANAGVAAADAVSIAGTVFTSPGLQRTFAAAGAHAAVVVAASAGPELEAEAHRRWQDGKPDEYFFLEVYGSAVVEHLITTTGARLCARADAENTAVLPHCSPGYPDWPIEDQTRLLGLIRRATAAPAGGGASGLQAIDVLPSGMLRPKKSLLAVFGLTRHVERVRPLTELNPCERCAFTPCQYRRAPYRGAAGHASPELAAFAARRSTDAPPAYSVNMKALERWRRERVTIDRLADGTVQAEFRYDGTTCTNMGRPIAFRYQVTLGPREDGYPIQAQRCAPVPGDVGHTCMCRYLTHAESLMASIDAERPLAGRPLSDVLSWRRPAHPAGCYCEADARHHKWGLVLETIYYALERASSEPPVSARITETP